MIWPPICKHDLCVSDDCVAGCECDAGFARDLSTGMCVEYFQCPSTDTTCPDGEVWSDCMSTCKEPYCCGMEEHPCINEACPDECQPGCHCDVGHARDWDLNGACVPVCTHYQQCGPHEFFNPNGSFCAEATCDVLFNDGQWTDWSQATHTGHCNDSQPMCECIDGYARNTRTCKFDFI